MIYIIGLGIQGKSSLSQRALHIIENADVLVGGKRHLACFPEFKGKKVTIVSNLNEIVKIIKHDSRLTTHDSQIVVLATGDPNFFGIADFLIRNLGKNKFEIIPNVSAMQEAFARIKENWNDARFLSVHGKYRGQGVKGSRGQEKNAFDTIVDKIVNYNKVGIFTDPENTPSKIARALLDKGIKDYTAYVCEDLGSEKEKVTQGTLSKIAKKKFSALNVMVLIKDNPPIPPLEKWGEGGFGIPDSEFSYSKGMITKQEIRVISLSKLKLKDNSIVWDIGAGSGSLSIEAALFARNGMVFAVEKEKNRTNHIEKNKKKFLADNLEIINKNAPAGLKTLPSPDAVFIGGGGKDIDKILNTCSKRIKPKGRIVVNAITIETLSIAAAFFKKLGWHMEIISVNIAKTKHVPVGFKQGDAANFNLFNACNPVFIIAGEKP